VARADSMTMAEAPLVAQATTDMIAACFQSTTETTERARAAIDQTMRQRIQRHITAHLESPSLHTEALCAEFRISRSQLYRLFEPLGGVAHYIQEQRLTRACAELCNPAHDHRRIYEIAFALGFSSEAHFSRVFRSTFGVSPSDVRGRAQATRVNASRPVSTADPNGGYEEIDNPAMLRLPQDAPQPRAIRVKVQEDWQVTGELLLTFEKCPRRFFYTHILCPLWAL